MSHDASVESAENAIDEDGRDTELMLWAVFSERQRRLLVWTARETERRTQRDFTKLMGCTWAALEARGHSIVPVGLIYCEHEPAHAVVAH